MWSSICKSSAHGAAMPAIGLGTGGLSERCAELVASALQAGYRHIDTGRKYGTERGVGEVIRASRRADDEMKRIHALKRPDGRIANPAGRAPLWDA